jgi:hypothetical protein
MSEFFGKERLYIEEDHHSEEHKTDEERRREEELYHEEKRRLGLTEGEIKRVVEALEVVSKFEKKFQGELKLREIMDHAGSDIELHNLAGEAIEVADRLKNNRAAAVEKSAANPKWTTQVKIAIATSFVGLAVSVGGFAFTLFKGLFTPTPVPTGVSQETWSQLVSAIDAWRNASDSDFWSHLQQFVQNNKLSVSGQIEAMRIIKASGLSASTNLQWKQGSLPLSMIVLNNAYNISTLSPPSAVLYNTIVGMQAVFIDPTNGNAEVTQLIPRVLAADLLQFVLEDILARSAT